MGKPHRNMPKRPVPAREHKPVQGTIPESMALIQRYLQTAHYAVVAKPIGKIAEIGKASGNVKEAVEALNSLDRLPEIRKWTILRIEVLRGLIGLGVPKSDIQGLAKSITAQATKRGEDRGVEIVKKVMKEAGIEVR